LTKLVRERGQWERAEEEEEVHTHQAPRCIPGRHGEAVPARSTRHVRGRTSPRCTGSTTPGASTGERTRRASTWASSAFLASSSGGAPHQSVRRRQIPSRESNPISSERKRSAIPFGGAGRGRVGEHFTQGGSNRGYRSWPEKRGGGGGGVLSRRRESRGGEVRGWGRSGSVWPTQDLAGWVRPAGLVGPGQWAKAHLQIQLCSKNLKFCFSFLINSNLKLNQFCLI
jgi:hypothetical protein